MFSGEEDMAVLGVTALETSSHFDIEWEMMAKAAKAGFKITEIPAVEKKRIHGQSHLSCLRDGWIIAKAIFRMAIKK